MTPSAQCIALIKKYEGCRLKAYPDPKTGGDPWTVGWGATGPGIARGTQWTQEQADDRLDRDVARFGRSVWAAIGEHPTTQARFDALTSFMFNLGAGKVLNSTLLRKHNAGDYAGAAAQFPLWISKGTPAEPGLRRRRADEMRLYQGLPI